MCVYMALTASNFLFLSCAGAESWRSCEQTSLQEDLKKAIFQTPPAVSGSHGRTRRITCL